MKGRDGWGRLARALGLFVALAGVIWLLHRLGRGSLAAPPLGSMDELQEWFDTRDPATAVFAVVRLVAVAMAWYVLAVLALGTLARVLRAGSLARAVDAVTLPALRRTVATLAGASLLSTGALCAAATAAVADTGPATEAAAPAPEAGSAPGAPTESLVALDEAARPTERLVALGDAASAPTETLIVLDEAEGAEGEATMRLLPDDKIRTPVATPSAALDTWVIERGEHLWAVAESHLADAWGRAPTDAEITPYWRQLIEHNRAQLPDPSNPDLVFPGMVVELPPVPTPPASGG